MRETEDGAGTSHIADEEGNVDDDRNNNSDDSVDNFEFEVKRSICNVKLDKGDLLAILNGYPRNPIKLQPYDKIKLVKRSWNGDVKLDLFQRIGTRSLMKKYGNRLVGIWQLLEVVKRFFKRLVNDYARGQCIWFNGELLNLEVRIAQPQQEIKDEKNGGGNNGR